MVCSACGAENRVGRRFCGECGTALAKTCPVCGAPNDQADKFCGECGSPLTASASAPAPPVAAPPSRKAPVAERRLVSILFADLVSFTSLSERRDAEEVRELLTRYFDTARQIIDRYGGTVEKFIGDAVMAVWGAPIAREDDAERAVRAALDLTESIAALGGKAGLPELKARAGVLTGEAAVTIGAQGQGMVAGDLVNTASRIQSVAEPGDVLVGEASKRASEAAIAYEDAGLHSLKGKAEPVRLWRAVRVVAARGGAMRSSGLEPPFVGRNRELRLIKELFHASAEDGRAHLVSVIGPPGIGKSRLVWEVQKYIDGLAFPIRWHRGRCIAYGEGVTYWALAEMVKTRAGIAEGEEAASALAKLKAALAESISDPEERAWVEPRLTHLLGLEGLAAGDREDLFAAWRLFYERLADEMPMVMVFEDIQWADASLLDFIEYLLEWSHEHPLFILTLARPEIAERRPTWGAGIRGSTSIHLDPLSGGAMETLLTGLVPGLPDELSGRVLDRAEGVPLYAVETVRMLLDRGFLIAEDGVYRPAGTVDTLEVPETLHALIAARLDGLSPAERRLVQDGAVLGKTFSKEALAAVTGVDADELEAALGSLVRKEILTVQADPLSPERGQYGFLGDLVRRVAYETLSKRERKALHLAVATYLEHNWEEEDVVEVVASHYLDAFRAAPDAPDAAGIKATARDALTRAGHRAASLAASEEARRYYEQAIELADDPLVRAELHERAGEMAWQAQLGAVAEAHYERAIEVFESEDATHPAARVSAALAEVLWTKGESEEEALRRLEQAFQILSREEPDDDLATLAAQFGRFLFFAGRIGEAFDRIELALQLAESLRLPEVLSQAMNTKSLILKSRGRTEEGLVLLQHALQVALDHNLGSAALRAYNNLCAFLGEANRHEDELRAAQEGSQLARKLGNRQLESILLACQINPLVAMGRWDEALVHVAEEREAEGPEPSKQVLTESGIILPVYVYRGDLAMARAELDRVATLAQSMDVQSRAVSAVWRALVLRAEGQSAAALSLAEGVLLDEAQLDTGFPGVVDSAVQALEAAFDLEDDDKIDALLEQLKRLPAGAPSTYQQAQETRFRARAAARRADDATVVPAFKSAVGMFRELAMPFWMAVALLEHGEWLVAQGQQELAQPLLREAREIFERLQAHPWLERMERISTDAARVGAEASS